jgi:hypothetical protein
MAGEPQVLRPLSTAEVIDVAFRLYRRHFPHLLAIAALVYVPLGILEALLLTTLFTNIGQLEGVVTHGGSPPPLSLPQVAGLAAGGSALGLLWLLSYVLVYAALAVAISRQYLGEQMSVGEAYRQVMPALLPLILTGLAVSLIVGVGIVFCILPGLYLAVLYAFTWPAVVLERRGVIEALRRSQELVSGHWGRVFGTMLLLSLIVFVIQAAVQVPLGLLITVLLGQSSVGQALAQLLSTLTSMVLLPLTMTGLIVLYYDLRVRKEGFDLQLLADQLAEGRVVPPAAGAAQAEAPGFAADTLPLFPEAEKPDAGRLAAPPAPSPPTFPVPPPSSPPTPTPTADRSPAAQAPDEEGNQQPGEATF